MSSRTTIITVTFNSADVVAGMLDSIPHGTAVVVVDNASSDDTLSRIGERHGVTVVRNDQNIGFGRACNTGAAKARTEFLLFLNPDARLEPDTLDMLESEADARPALGAANPLVVDAKGRAHLKMSSLLPLPDLPRPAIDTAGLMPVLSGAALFVRRAVFEEVSGFDPAIFLYHEDHELTWRIRNAGHELWHLPAARVVHFQGTGSPRQAGTAYWKGYQMARSRHYVIEKHAAGSGFRRTFWPALMGYCSPINIASKRRRAKYRGQLAGALSARKDGGRFA